MFHIEHCLKINHELEQLLATLNDKERRLLDSYWHYQANIFDKFDEKVKAGVHATIAQVLSPFNHPDLSNMEFDKTVFLMD